MKNEMNALTNIQYINNAQGTPTYAVIPIEALEWLKQQAGIQSPLETGVPAAVVNLAFDRDISALRAWREHLGLTQAEVALRLGISQSAYSQHENAKTLRKKTRQKIAAALGLHEAQLDF